jgi:dihydrodipicolinate reductase
METPEEVEAKKRAEREEEKRRMDLEDRVKDLEVEVVCARGREEEARKAMEEFAKAQMQARCANLSLGVRVADKAIVWRS